MSRAALKVGGDPETLAQQRVTMGLNFFLRTIALFYLALAAVTWAWAVGAWPNPDIRFDTVTSLERTMLAVFAVLHPVCAVGLWSTVAWGKVVWFLTILAHAAGSIAQTQSFFVPRVILVIDVMFLAMFACFATALWLLARQVKVRKA